MSTPTPKHPAPNPPSPTRTYTTPSGRTYTVTGGFAEARDLYDFDKLPSDNPSPDANPALTPTPNVKK